MPNRRLSPSYFFSERPQKRPSSPLKHRQRETVRGAVHSSVGVWQRSRIEDEIVVGNWTYWTYLVDGPAVALGFELGTVAGSGVPIRWPEREYSSIFVNGQSDSTQSWSGRQKYARTESGFLLVRDCQRKTFVMMVTLSQVIMFWFLATTETMV